MQPIARKSPVDPSQRALKNQLSSSKSNQSIEFNVPPNKWILVSKKRAKECSRSNTNPLNQFLQCKEITQLRLRTSKNSSSSFKRVEPRML